MKIKVTLDDGTVIEIEDVKDVEFNTWHPPTIECAGHYAIKVAVSPCASC